MMFYGLCCNADKQSVILFLISVYILKNYAFKNKVDKAKKDFAKLEKLKVLMLGDAIGTPGLEQIYMKLPAVLRESEPDLVIVNGENSDEGFGITEEIYEQLLDNGIDVVTSGNHIWSNADAGEILQRNNGLLRPHNYPDAPGKGWWRTTIDDVNIGVVNLIGRYFMTPVDSPFQTLENLLKNELSGCKVVIVDFHAEFMNEKKALAIDFDGRISFLAGTHTHVQTADEVIFRSGTGYITDIGMCGGIDSVIGMERSAILQKIKRQVTQPYVPAIENGKMQGVFIDIDCKTGKTLKIERLSI